MSVSAAPAAETVTRRIRLEGVRVRDFRNLASVDVSPAPEGFALIGENGHGKTNLLEALYYLQLFRSFRATRDTELVRFGAPGFHVSATAHGASAGQVAVGFECAPGQRAGGRKRIRIDGSEPDTIADAVGVIPAVLFAPRDAAMIGGGPSERRRFLDVMLSLSSRAYLRSLQRYRAALVRRNIALREAQRGGDLDAVAAWEPALAEAGTALVRERSAWALGASGSFSRLCERIGERGNVELRYQSALAGCDDVERALAAALERRRSLHVRRGVTLDGPHRDDLVLELDGRELRAYGSAGQHRTAAIALRLLEASTLRAARDAEPIVLLDDPFAELDARRSGRILELLEDGAQGQTVLAVPRESEVPAHFTRLERFRVVHGAIQPALT